MKEILNSFSNSISECISVVDNLGEEQENQKNNKTYKNIHQKMNSIKSILKNEYSLMTFLTDGFFNFFF